MDRTQKRERLRQGLLALIEQNPARRAPADRAGTERALRRGPRDAAPLPAGTGGGGPAAAQAGRGHLRLRAAGRQGSTADVLLGGDAPARPAAVQPPAVHRHRAGRRQAGAAAEDGARFGGGRDPPPAPGQPGADGAGDVLPGPVAPAGFRSGRAGSRLPVRVAGRPVRAADALCQAADPGDRAQRGGGRPAGRAAVLAVAGDRADEHLGQGRGDRVCEEPVPADRYRFEISVVR